MLRCGSGLPPFSGSLKAWSRIQHMFAAGGLDPEAVTDDQRRTIEADEREFVA